MRARLPEPLRLPWELKPNLEARSGSEKQADGRRRYWVDEVLKGVTPKMLVWWFSHLEGDMEVRLPHRRLASSHRPESPVARAELIRNGVAGTPESAG